MGLTFRAGLASSPPKGCHTSSHLCQDVGESAEWILPLNTNSTSGGASPERSWGRMSATGGQSWRRTMVHTTLIGAHGASGLAALAVGSLALHQPCQGGQTAFRVYLGALWLMVLCLLLVVAL